LVDVERWAELRREHFVRGVSIKQLARRGGLSRNTIRAALRSSMPPKYRRERAGSKLDPFKDEIHDLLRRDPDMPGQRVRELIVPLGFDGGKTIVDDYLREVRAFFVTPRTFQRTVYRPGEICQFDVWEPEAEIPVGHGQTREAWVVVACLGYSRAGAGALVFSKQIPELLFGIRRCLWSLARCRRRWSGTARPGCTPPPAAQAGSSPASAGSCGSAGTSAPRVTRRPRAEGVRYSV
jgi:transposase